MPLGHHPRGFFFSALCGTNAAVLETAAFICFGGAASAVAVGYAGNALDLEGGAILTSAQFMDVGCKPGGEKISLSKLKPVPASETTDLEYCIQFQLMDNGGYTSLETTYEWYNGCWNLQGQPVGDDVTFDAGQGLWVYNWTYEGVSFHSSGEVQQTDINYPLDLDGGAVGVVNAFPTPIKLSEITPIPASETTDLEYCIQIQKMDNGGYTSLDTTYEWYNGCWNLQGVPCGDSITIQPGEGLWVYNWTYETVSLHIPAPEL